MPALKGNCSVVLDTKNRIALVADPDGKWNNDNVNELVTFMGKCCTEQQKAHGKQVTITIKPPFIVPDAKDAKGNAIKGSVPKILCRGKQTDGDLPTSVYLGIFPEGKGPSAARSVTKLG